MDSRRRIIPCGAKASGVFARSLGIAALCAPGIGRLIATERSIMSSSLGTSTHSLREQAPVWGVSEPPLVDSADELCNELMDHIFECEACINDLEESCETYRSLRERIAKAGGPTKSALLAV